jgi:hypothetical protein
MTDDLVKRLRVCAAFDPDQAEAADRIEQLEARVLLLEGALQVYACKDICPNCYGAVQDTRYCGWTARTALKTSKERVKKTGEG